MNLHKIECFIKTYEELNLSRAAQKLYITQQGLSRIIISIETDLGVKLFNRNPGGLTPTDYGDSFYYYACSMMKSFQMARIELDNIKEGQEDKTLNVGVSDGVFPSLDLSEAIKKFRALYPETGIHTISKPDMVCKELLLKDEIDCAFLVGMVSDTDIQSTLIHQEPIYAWINTDNPLSRKSAISLEDLISQPLIMVDDQYHYRKALNSWYSKKGLEPDIRYMSNDILTLHYLARKNEGIALHPRYWRELVISDDSLRSVPVTDIDFSSWQVNLCRLNRPFRNPYEKVFIEFMLEEYIV